VRHRPFEREGDNRACPPARQPLHRLHLLIPKCDLFANDLSLETSPYITKSGLSFTDLGAFLRSLEDRTVKTTNNNSLELSRSLYRIDFIFHNSLSQQKVRLRKKTEMNYTTIPFEGKFVFCAQNEISEATSIRPLYCQDMSVNTFQWMRVGILFH
jgi:hypothetical protein